MHWPCAHDQIPFEMLYRTYWERVVRFCHKHLASLPDGTAEEVAQDVFLVAYEAMVQQHYRGEGPISTWLFGIAHNLCCKTRRDAHRRTTSRTLRHLEREITRLEQEVAHLMRAPSPLACTRLHLMRDQLTLVHAWIERERAQLQRHIMVAVHSAPAAPLDQQFGPQDSLAAMQDSFQQLARCARQMHTLLHMYVIKEATVREIATFQGMSRAAVYRRLTRAKTELRKVYQGVTHARESCTVEGL